MVHLEATPPLVACLKGQVVQVVVHPLPPVPLQEVQEAPSPLSDGVIPEVLEAMLKQLPMEVQEAQDLVSLQQVQEEVVEVDIPR